MRDLDLTGRHEANLQTVAQLYDEFLDEMCIAQAKQNLAYKSYYRYFYMRLLVVYRDPSIPKEYALANCIMIVHASKSIHNQYLWYFVAKRIWEDIVLEATDSDEIPSLRALEELWDKLKEQLSDKIKQEYPPFCRANRPNDESIQEQSRIENENENTEARGELGGITDECLGREFQ